MTNPTLASLVRTARQAKGLSLRALARLCRMQSSSDGQAEIAKFQGGAG